MSSMRELFPQQYKRWVVGVCSVGMVAYAVTTLLVLSQHGLGGLIRYTDPYIAILCALGVERALRGQPERAAVLALVAVAADLHIAFFATGSFELASALGLPVYVLAAGLLFGRRGALGVSLLLAVTVPISVIAGAYTFHGGFQMPEDPFIPVGAELVVLGTGILLHGFFRTFEMMVVRARQTAHYVTEILQASPDAMIGLDGEQHIDTFNPAAVRLLGKSVEQVMGRSVVELQLRDAQGRQVTNVAPFKDSNHAVEMHPEQGEIVLEALTRSTTRPDGTQGSILVLRDVSQRRQVEEQARTLQEQLLHTQKMEAVGQLAGGVAHDFNNLLTAIGGLAYTLAREENARAQETAQQLLAAQEHGASLTRQLLAFARKDAVDSRPLDLGNLLERMGTLMRRSCGETIRLNLAVAPSCVMVGDVGQLEQIVLNLITNACDAMPDGGELFVESRCDKKRVELVVRDTGIGMSEDIHSRVFEPFFTTKARGRGTGLGLSTVHGLVIQSGGSIELESAPGEGTTFYLKWPRVSALPDESPHEAPALESLRGSELIFLAEDNDWVRTFVRDVLQRNGYRVVVARDGDEALEKAVRLDPPPKLLVTDVVMPGHRGPVLARQLTKKIPDLEALFISGYLDDVVESELAGRLLRKPFAAEELLVRVRERLDAHAGVDREGSSSAPIVVDAATAADDRSLILIIDDEAMVGEAMVSAYRVIGQRALTFESLDAAAEAAQGRSVCLVIIDWRMPGISGVDAVARARALWPNSQLAIVSGDLSEIPKEMENSVLDTVQKPISIRLLKDLAVRAACPAGEPEL